jgi:hypothetical protein
MELFFIPAGRYIEPAMQAEFGRLPPVLLPLKNGTLFEQQIANADNLPDDRLVSLPEDYAAPRWVEAILRGYGFNIVRTRQSASLGEAIRQALLLDGRIGGGLRILHGDTLISRVNASPDDLISIHRPAAAAYWARSEASEIQREFTTTFIENEDPRALSGYFSFSSTSLFLQALEHARGDFIKALSIYNGSRTLETSSQGSWYDFGHLQTYFGSRASFTTERHFNDLRFDRETVRKASSQVDKIRAEANWFEKIPSRLRLFTPRLVEAGPVEGGGFSYELEHLHLCTLSELFVFCDVPIQEWRRIIDSCVLFLKRCRSFHGDANARLDQLYREKTYERLVAYCDVEGLTLDRPWTFNGTEIGTLEEIVERAVSIIDLDRSATVMHGDFCFSNILYDSRIGSIRAIDPRGGIDPSKASIFGDGLYDVGKLYHSFFGYYDLILAGRYRYASSAPYTVELEFETSDKQVEIKTMFEAALQEAGFVDADQGVAVATLLFLSMIPLHADRPDRQKAFLANALRLAQSLVAKRESA